MDLLAPLARAAPTPFGKDSDVVFQASWNSLLKVRARRHLDFSLNVYHYQEPPWGLGFRVCRRVGLSVQDIEGSGLRN
jgi:hypothetical protein